MNLAPSYLAALASILAIIFPDVDIEAINTTLNTIVIVASSVMVMVRQVITKRSTLVGSRPE